MLKYQQTNAWGQPRTIARTSVPTSVEVQLPPALNPSFNEMSSLNGRVGIPLILCKV